MKKYLYIPIAQNIVSLLIVAFSIGGVNSYFYDLTHEAKAGIGNEKKFEVFLNNGQVPHQASFERQSSDDEFREGSQLFITSLFQNFVNTGFRFTAAKISWREDFNKIQFFASPLFLINRVFQV